MSAALTRRAGSAEMSTASHRLLRPALLRPALAFCAARGAGQRRRLAARAASGAAVAGGAAAGERFTITTPLYYVNAPPHMGSAYPTIAADVLARYNRLRGKDVRFVTGTDEHGEKIALAAAARGLTPQQHCDDIVSSYKSLWAQARARTPFALHPQPAPRLLTRHAPLPPARRADTAAGHPLRRLRAHDGRQPRGGGEVAAGARVGGRRRL